MINHDIAIRAALEMNRCELAERHGLPRAPMAGAPYDLDACDEPECMLCAIVACNHAEPMHFHHDGCPAYYTTLVPCN